MRSDESHEHVRVAVEAGSPDEEDIGVLPLGNETYRVVVPPLFTFGLARGDEFRVDPETRRPEVLKRSGNVLVWVYPAAADVAATTELAESVSGLGGRYEGSGNAGRVLVFTIPVHATFAAIEATFDAFVAGDPGAQWLFGNVYADDGTTPLDWWIEDFRPGERVLFVADGTTAIVHVSHGGWSHVYWDDEPAGTSGGSRVRNTDLRRVHTGPTQSTS